MRGMANLPQGNQELLVAKDKVGRHQVGRATVRAAGFTWKMAVETEGDSLF